MKMNQTHPWWWRGRGGVGDGEAVTWGQRGGGSSGGEWVVVMEKVRGGAWFGGSGRSSDGEAFGTWSENSPEKFSGGGGGGDRNPAGDSGLAVPVFKQGDDPIDSINKMMSFLSTIVTSCLLSTNNQLRNSSNPRQQATIHDGKVTVQPLQGRPNSYVVGTSGTRANTSET
ncbi:hypothetical protein Tco_1448153 [Tanacetum coccineum]